MKSATGRGDARTSAASKVAVAGVHRERRVGLPRMAAHHAPLLCRGRYLGRKIFKLRTAEKGVPYAPRNISVGSGVVERNDPSEAVLALAAAGAPGKECGHDGVR